MNRTRVLVVEDDDGFQEIYEKFFDLHQNEFAWSLAKTGDAAITALKDDARGFHVALIDWHLKGGTADGFQVLQAALASRQMVTFMVTANEDERSIQAAIGAGADDYITKPFKMDFLAARLRGHLDKARKQTPDEDQVLELDGLKLTGGLVELYGRDLDLKKTEIALLQVFLERPDRILTQDFLWQSVRAMSRGRRAKP